MTGVLIAVEDAVQPVDGIPYFELVEERFGIPRRVFEPYVVFQPNKQNLWIVDRGLRIPDRPPHHTVGIPFFYVNMRFPRLTTLAAVKFGHDAVRNVFDASDGETAMLLHRHEIRVDRGRAASMTGHGYVMLRRHGLPIGLGFFHPEDDGDWLRGMLPRSWVVRTGIPSPVVPDLETTDGATWESDMETGR
ncbi:MAG: hypothetical protein MPN21_07715 [Thermoanaerobaculia bacterium]|nr:hypothetical protein [Thermoanaerobaculia bacterium]